MSRLTQRVCEQLGCANPYLARGMCKKHYARQRWPGKSRSSIETIVLYALRGTRTHSSWDNMIQRCYNPKARSYDHYGGRGIEVCDRWRTSVFNFVEDMGTRPVGMTLDRKDGTQGYKPGNCRWATYSQQSVNTRRKLPRSGHRNVHYWPQRKCWRVELARNGRRHVLSNYPTVEDAIAARDALIESMGYENSPDTKPRG